MLTTSTFSKREEEHWLRSLSLTFFSHSLSSPTHFLLLNQKVTELVTEFCVEQIHVEQIHVEQIHVEQIHRPFIYSLPFIYYIFSPIHIFSPQPLML